MQFVEILKSSIFLCSEDIFVRRLFEVLAVVVVISFYEEVVTHAL